jgi:hypothetical protein
VSVAALSAHAAAGVRNKRAATTPSGVGQWHPTTIARLRRRLRILDTFGLVRDDLIAAPNDEPDSITDKLSVTSRSSGGPGTILPPQKNHARRLELPPSGRPQLCGWLSPP